MAERLYSTSTMERYGLSVACTLYSRGSKEKAGFEKKAVFMLSPGTLLRSPYLRRVVHKL